MMLACLFLVACKPEVIIKREIVPVPYIVFEDVPPAAIVENIHLRIFDLTPESKEEEIALAYVESIIILTSLLDQHKASLLPFKGEN